MIETKIDGYRVKLYPIVNYGEVIHGYYISECLRIFSVMRGDLRENTVQVTKKNRSPYPHVFLRNGRGRKSVMMHRIVAQVFIPLPNVYPGVSEREWRTTPDSVKNILIRHLQVNHKNGNTLDYRIKNLEWLTGEENIKHYHRELRKY